MVELNTDAIHRIAEFLPINPVVYCRLAMVNHAFYNVFTSNRRWAHLNPYEITSSVFRHFLDKKARSQGIASLLKFAWSDHGVNWSPKVIVRTTNNRYVWLGLMRKTQHPLDDFADMPHLIKATMHLNPTQWNHFPPNFFQDFEYAMLAAELNLDVFVNEFRGNERQQLIDKLIRNPIRPINNDCLPWDQVTREMYDIAIRANPLNYSINPEWGAEYLSDKYIAQTLLLYRPPGFQKTLGDFPELADDKEFILQVVAEWIPGLVTRNEVLTQVSDRLRDDKEVVLASIKLNTFNYQHASDRLKSDPDVMFCTARCQAPPKVLYQFALGEITPDIAMELLKQGACEDYLDWDCKVAALRPICQTLLQADPSFIYDAEETLSPYEARRALIRHHPHRVVDMSNSEPEYENLVKMAICVDALLLFHVPGARRNIEYIKVALKSNAWVFHRLDNEFRVNNELILLAAKYWPSANAIAPHELKSNREAVAIMAANGTILPEEIPHEYRGDISVLKNAVSWHGTFDRALLSKREIALTAVKAKRACIHYIPFDKDTGTELMREAVEEDGALFAKLAPRYLHRQRVFEAIGPLDRKETALERDLGYQVRRR